MRKKIKYSVKENFGFNWAESKDRMVEGYTSGGEFTPKVDPYYVFPKEETKVALLGLHLRDKTLMFGHSGCGKTTLWEQIAARLRYNFIRINFDSAITRSDLVGQYVVEGTEMKWQDGILPRAMEMPGTIIVFDEWDTVGEEVAFVLQRPLEENGQLLIMEQGDRVVGMHPDNVFVATANTSGMGDETGLYSTGTRVQNYSQLNRFQLTIELDYLKPEQEQKAIALKNPKLSNVEAEAVAKVAAAIRKAYKEGTLSFPVSTRDALNWAEKLVIWGDAAHAAKYTFVNRYPLEEREALSGIIQRAFG